MNLSLCGAASACYAKVVILYKFKALFHLRGQGGSVQQDTIVRYLNSGRKGTISTFDEASDSMGSSVQIWHIR